MGNLGFVPEVKGKPDPILEKKRAYKNQVLEDKAALDLKIRLLQSKEGPDMDEEDRKMLKDDKEKMERLVLVFDLAGTDLTFYEAKKDPASDPALVKGHESNFENAKKSLESYDKQRPGPTT